MPNEDKELLAVLVWIVYDMENLLRRKKEHHERLLSMLAQSPNDKNIQQEAAEAEKSYNIARHDVFNVLSNTNDYDALMDPALPLVYQIFTKIRGL